MGDSSIEVNPKNLEAEIEVLSRAVREFQLTRIERISYRSLMFSVDIGIVSFVLIILLFTLYAALSPESDIGGNYILPILIIVLFNMIISIFIGVLCLILNIPLLIKTFREKAKIKELGLNSLSKSLWKESRRTGWLWTRWLTRARGTILVLLGSWLFLGAGAVEVIFLKNDIGFNATHVLALSCAVIGIMLFGAWYLRQQRERIDLALSATKLRETLQNLQRRAGEGVVSVPSGLFKQAAGIESAQIAKERGEAILKSVALRPTGYSVKFDRVAAGQRRELDTADRIQLEDLIAQLSTEGRLDAQFGAPSDSDGISLTATTVNKHIEIEYVLDQASRSIRITAIRPASDRAG